MLLPAAKEVDVVAYRLLSYEVAILQDQIALTLQYATTRAEAAAGKRRILRLAMPPGPPITQQLRADFEAAAQPLFARLDMLRDTKGLIEATRSQIFDATEQSIAEH